jgi:mRNA-degrading endonuclease RelE of RelBE toxin-antitoxin system
MKFEIIVTDSFQKQAKPLLKKYVSLRKEIAAIVEAIAENPYQGSPIGNNCYKIRIKIKSKGKGKSGGARIIYLVKVINRLVFFVSIYDKSEKENLSDKELQNLINWIK